MWHQIPFDIITYHLTYSSLRQLLRPRASMSGTVVSAMDLVKAVDAAVKAIAENEPSRAVDSLQFLTKQDVTASLLLSTGAGKKVRCMSIQAA